MPSQGPTTSRERAAWTDCRLLVGIDEVGRGPLAGPVVAAAVAFPPACPRIRGIRDSKVLTARRREKLAGEIRRRAILIGVGAASPRLVDRLNIRGATALAMRRALSTALGRPITRGTEFPGFTILVDGLPFHELGFGHQALVDGDALCYSIAAAGILAKTIRDRLMMLLGRRYPDYGWDSNMGYGTPDHLEGIERRGPTPHHRRSFTPVSQLQLWARAESGLSPLALDPQPLHFSPPRGA